ncbi:MAG: ParA family protein [Lachnospiraceae bacterium]
MGEQNNCRVIAIANQKGGVGKTTTTSNLGIGLARQGKRVLLIDADAQGSLTASLGFREPDKLDITLANVMANAINEEEMKADYGILKHEEGIDLMPGNIELSGIEVSLVNVMMRETVLRSYIDNQRERYDYILIDCMPSLGMLTINAVAAADSVLIPVQAAYLPVKGLEQLIKTIGKVKRQINTKLEIEGILMTMVDSRTNYAKDISRLVVENYGSRVKVFNSSIPMSVRAAEISAEGTSIYKHDPNGKVAKAYQSLTEEVLGNE